MEFYHKTDVISKLIMDISLDDGTWYQTDYTPLALDSRCPYIQQYNVDPADYESLQYGVNFIITEADGTQSHSFDLAENQTTLCESDWNLVEISSTGASLHYQFGGMAESEGMQVVQSSCSFIKSEDFQQLDCNLISIIPIGEDSITFRVKRRTYYLTKHEGDQTVSVPGTTGPGTGDAWNDWLNEKTNGVDNSDLIRGGEFNGRYSCAATAAIMIRNIMISVTGGSTDDYYNAADVPTSARSPKGLTTPKTIDLSNYLRQERGKSNKNNSTSKNLGGSKYKEDLTKLNGLSVQDKMDAFYNAVSSSVLIENQPFIVRTNSHMFLGLGYGTDVYYKVVVYYVEEWTRTLWGESVSCSYSTEETNLGKTKVMICLDTTIQDHDKKVLRIPMHTELTADGEREKAAMQANGMEIDDSNAFIYNDGSSKESITEISVLKPK